MTDLTSLAFRSLWNRRWSAGLAILSIALSAAVLLAVDKVRSDARSSFANTISGTDLIIGARTGSVQLMLYAVFRIGDAPNSIRWKTYLDLASDPRIAWSVPLALGDSHRGFRLVGTTSVYFDRLRYADNQPLTFKEGGPFQDVYDVVLGAQVARSLGYTLGQKIVVSHGTGTVVEDHDDKPFTVVGILSPTGTPVDRSLHVGLDGIEAIHVDWTPRAKAAGRKISAEDAREMDLTPSRITAALIGLTNRTQIFRVQRDVNRYIAEPVMSVLPGAALAELWSIIGVAERALTAIAICAVAASLLGMAMMLLAALESRRREIAVLRAIGARPIHIVLVLLGEAFILTCLGVLIGFCAVTGLIVFVSDWLATEHGLYLSSVWPATSGWILLAMIVGAGLIAGTVPALIARGEALSQGLIPRL